MSDDVDSTVFDLWFDEEYYLLWHAYNNSVELGVLNEHELNNYLRYPMTKTALSPYATLRK